MAKSTRKRDSLPEKICVTCGRGFSWRKKWANTWEDVKFCGEQCRRNRPSLLEENLEAAILSLSSERGPRSSICPSEAARNVSTEDWKSLMEPTRQAARRLAHLGLVEITQGGKVVDPSNFRGPIRLRVVPGIDASGCEP